MAHLAAGTREALAVEVEVGVGVGGEEGERVVGLVPNEIGHHHLVHARHHARLRQRQPADGAHQLLELARGAALDRPVA